MIAKAGHLRELCDIWQEDGDTNTPQPTYGTIFMRDVPCQISSVSGDESFRGRQLEAGVSYVVECHRLTGITPDMRLEVTGGAYSGRYLNIAHVRDMTAEGVPWRMQLYCRELAL